MIFTFRNLAAEREQAAQKVVDTYRQMRAEGRLEDEWNTFIEERNADDDDMCFGILLAMALGGLEVPMAQREAFGPVMEEWTHLAYLMGDLPE